MRPWKSDFVKATEESVTIRTSNGKLYTLKLEEISEADQEFVKERLAESESGGGRRRGIDGQI